MQDARLRIGTYERKVVIRDMSRIGLMIETELELPVGRQVVIVLSAAKEVRARVRWCKKGRLGVAFDVWQSTDSHGRSTRAKQAAPVSLSTRFWKWLSN